MEGGVHFALGCCSCPVITLAIITLFLVISLGGKEKGK